MKILILSPWFAPAYNAGGPVRSLLNLVNAQWQGLEIYILTSDRDVDGRTLPSVQAGQWNPFGAESHIFYLNRSGLRRTLRREIRALKPDVLFISGIYSWSFSIWPLLCYRSALNIVSARGMLHPEALRKKRVKKSIFLFLYRPFIKWMRVIFHATDEREALFVRQALGEKIPVKFAFNIPELISLPPLFKERGKLKIIILALIGPMKNHLRVIKALQLVLGHVDLHIVGPVYDKAYWDACLQAAAKLPSTIYFHYHGEVPPDQVADFLSLAHIFTGPSESENFGHSILEALSAGKPVITSYGTPWTELESAKAGMNVLVSEKDIADAIQVFINMSNEEYQTWSAAAAAYARSRIDLQKIKSQYISLFTNQ